MLIVMPFPDSAVLSAGAAAAVEGAPDAAASATTAAHEALAPLHWDAEEFDFGVVSEDESI